MNLKELLFIYFLISWGYRWEIWIGLINRRVYEMQSITSYAHSKNLNISWELAWVYKNKSRAGHGIHFQWECRFKLWHCWGSWLRFFFHFARFLMGGTSSNPFNSQAVFGLPFGASGLLHFSQVLAEGNLTQWWALSMLDVPWRVSKMRFSAKIVWLVLWTVCVAEGKSFAFYFFPILQNIC